LASRQISLLFPVKRREGLETDCWRIQDNPGPPGVEYRSQPPLLGVI
jgi:hypothetical protein